MQEYSERNWPIQDMIGAFPDGWNDIVQDILPTNECDICGPPLDIGPPPPLPANFQGLIDSSGNCNMCHMVNDVDSPPLLQSEASILPIVTTLFVSLTLTVVTLTVLLVKVKKCRSFFSRGPLWIFPRNLLPHTELAPSSLPSPSPSTEKLKNGQKLWHGSSRSIQSENIYEVCSPPSQDSLYEEVGPPPLTKSGLPCSPYGVVLVNKENGMGIVTPGIRDLRSSNISSNRAMLEPNLGIMYQQQAKAMFGNSMPIPHFSTFGGSGRGFFNPAVRDTISNNGFMYPGSAHTLGSAQVAKNALKYSENVDNNLMQKRKLPPVPANDANFSL